MTLSMNTFYIQLSSEEHQSASSLVKLTHMSLEQLSQITSKLTWSIWD